MGENGIHWTLIDGEKILWQGRPAPRCYTFRHWMQATIGTILFFASSFWMMVGLQLVRAEGYSMGLVIAPFLLASIAFLIGPGQIMLARLRWEKIFYALTDQRLLVRNKIFGDKTLIYPMDCFNHYKQKRYGKKLCSYRLSFKNSKSIVLECLEHPENLLDLLPSKNNTK